MCLKITEICTLWAILWPWVNGDRWADVKVDGLLVIVGDGTMCLYSRQIDLWVVWSLYNITSSFNLKKAFHSQSLTHFPESGVLSQSYLQSARPQLSRRFGRCEIECGWTLTSRVTGRSFSSIPLRKSRNPNAFQNFFGGWLLLRLGIWSLLLSRIYLYA